MSTWFVIDTETGGLDPQRHAILSVGAVALDTAAGRIAAVEIPVADPGGEVTEEAVMINRIDVHRVGPSPSEAVRRLKGFIWCGR